MAANPLPKVLVDSPYIHKLTNLMRHLLMPIAIDFHDMPAVRLSLPLSTLMFVVVLSFLQGAPELLSQTNVLDSNPLSARRQYVYSLLGGYVGLSNNQQGGTFTTSCNCEFTGGTGVAVTAGVVFERLTRSTITFGAALGFEGRGIESRFQEIELLAQNSPTTGREYNVPVTFRNTAGSSIWLVNLMPYAKYHLYKSFWVRGGPSISAVVSARITHEKELLTTEVVLPGGEQASVRLRDVDGTTVQIEDAEIPELNRLQISAVVGAGLDIKVGKAFYLGPIVQFVYPFTTISGRGTEFSIRSVQLLLEGKFIL